MTGCHVGGRAWQVVEAADVKLFPCLFMDEEGEEGDADDDGKPTERDKQRAETEGALKVDAEGNENAVGAEGAVYPTEAEGEA